MRRRCTPNANTLVEVHTSLRRENPVICISITPLYNNVGGGVQKDEMVLQIMDYILLILEND